MKKIILICLLAVTFQSCIYINSQDDIPPRGESTRTYDLRSFDQLKMEEAFYVNVTEGAAYSVEVTGELNDLDDLDIFVQDGKLVARYRNSWRNRQRMDIEVTMPTITKVDFSGAVNSTIEGFENLSKIEFRLTGASDCEFAGSVQTINFDLDGASQLYLSGNGKFLDGDLSGASKLDAFGSPVEESDIKLSGASKAYVSVSKFLKVEASGASDVRYKGSPSIEQHLSGASTLRRE